MINNKRIYKFISVTSLIVTIALIANLLMPSFTMAQGDGVIISQNENTLEIKTKISALNVNKSMLYVIKAENLEIPTTPEAMEKFANNHVNEIKGIITETEQTFTHNVDEPGKYYAVVLLIQDKEIEDGEGNKVTSGVYTSARSSSYVVKFDEEVVEKEEKVEEKIEDKTENKTENKVEEKKEEVKAEVKTEPKQEEKKEEVKKVNQEEKKEESKPEENKPVQETKTETKQEQKQEEKTQATNNQKEVTSIEVENKKYGANIEDTYDDYIELEEGTEKSSDENNIKDIRSFNAIKDILNKEVKMESAENTANKEDVKEEIKEEQKAEEKVETKQEENKVEVKQEEKKEENKQESKVENIFDGNVENKEETNNNKTRGETFDDVKESDIPSKLPQTGDDKTGVMCALVFFSLLSIGSFVKYRLS